MTKLTSFCRSLSWFSLITCNLNVMTKWKQLSVSKMCCTITSSLCLSTGVTVEFNTMLTVKLRYLGCRVLTALSTPPPSSTLWAVDEWTITGQLRWALGSSGFRTFPWLTGWLVLTQAVFALSMGAARKEACLCWQRKGGGRRFNLADGGTGTLRASHTVRHAHTWAYVVTDKWAEEGCGLCPPNILVTGWASWEICCF